MNPPVTAWLLVLLASLPGACAFVDDTCDPCVKPPDAVGGFPRVQREAGTSRVVSTLKVGEAVYICIFTPCGCTPAYSVDWRSTDPSVASLTVAGDAPLTVCNDAFDSVRTGGGAQTALGLKGLRPGETRISVIASGGALSTKLIPNTYCSRGAGAECLTVDVVRVVPEE